MRAPLSRVRARAGGTRTRAARPHARRQPRDALCPLQLRARATGVDAQALGAGLEDSIDAAAAAAAAATAAAAPKFGLQPGSRAAPPAGGGSILGGGFRAGTGLPTDDENPLMCVWRGWVGWLPLGARAPRACAPCMCAPHAFSPP